MKTINCFYLLLILLSFLIFTYEAGDTCPNGMRKTFINDQNMIQHGSARAYYGAVAFFQFPGSLFFNRQVLIEPRFEVHLKANTQAIDIVESQRENKIYGFTIVISGYKNSISGLDCRVYDDDVNPENVKFADIGYNNFVNSLIIEFDFEQDVYDPDSNSFSVRYCGKTCHSYDNIASHTSRLNYQRYDTTRENNWDFRLIYVEKKLILYSGESTIIYNAAADLESLLGTNIAYVGFTGFMESNRREISLVGTFICEDNYQMPLMPGVFSVNGNSYTVYNFEAGATINYIFSFINNKNEIIPHTFGYNIWQYSFSVTSDCGETTDSITKISNYTLQFLPKACTKVGPHTLHLSEKNKGNAPDLKYNVYAGPMKKIVLIGYNGKITTVPLKVESNYKYLNYGDSLSGDFIFKNNKQIVLEFDVTDQYGNPTTVSSPLTLFVLKNVNSNGDVFTVTPKVISYTFQPKDGHYQMILKIYKIGTYHIEKNEYMSEPIRFNIVPGEVDETKSFCTLNGAPIVKAGTDLFVAECTGGNEQKFTINSADNSIVDFVNKFCLDVPYCYTDDNIHIQIYPCHLKDKSRCQQSLNQEFVFNSDGTIVSRSSNKCLNVYNNHIVQTFTCNGGANQKWVYNKDDHTIKNGNLCLSPFDVLDNAYEPITSAPTLGLNEIVYYVCYLRDSEGNEITTSQLLKNSIYNFNCENQRIEPSSKTYSTEILDRQSYYSCKYITNDVGKFEINGYLTKKGTSTRTKINPKINLFYVRGNPDSYILKNVLNLYTKKWLSIDGAEITYLYDQNGQITALDFAESNGQTLISSYSSYPSNFDVTKVKAVLFSTHDPNWKFGELEARIIYTDGKPYIGIFTKDKLPTDKLVKKSSVDYSLKITFEKSKETVEKIVRLKYIINIGSYKTCFHNLDLSKTKLDMEWSLEFLIGASERKFAKIELQTTDTLLYNYDIGKENIKLILDNNPTNAIQFRVVPLSIEGTYEVYGKAVASYSGNLRLLIKETEIRKVYVYSQPSLACYLEFKKPELFIHTGDEFKEHYYEYNGTFVDGNLEFFFRILDKYKNVIIKDDYFSAYADIYSLQFGNDLTKFNVGYNHPSEAFQFRDKLPFETRQYTWVFFMRDSTCNNKYYITYDGMRRGSTPVSKEKSFYTLLNYKINVKEYAYVEVIYKDTNNQFYGLQSGKLEKIQSTTIVKGTSSDGKQVNFQFDSITSNYAIRYKYLFDIFGTFTITATSDGYFLKNSGSNVLTVVDNIYSLKHSKLQMIKDTIIEMNPNKKISIDNTFERPYYRLYFYTASGLKTTYSQDIVFTCVMTGEKVSMTLNVEKKTDCVQFTYKNDNMEEFVALVKGDYKLTITDKKESVEYPLYLTGDGSDDISNEPDYVIEKTEVNPTHIDGVAGKTYTINIEFRTANTFRWNYLVDTSKFSFSNSYNLSGEKFTTKVEQGYKRGQAFVYVTQTVVTTERDNILTLKYDGKTITKTVSLTIECGDFSKLEYVSGPTKGNVITPPILTFKPVDIYGNIYTGFFTSTTREHLNSLTIGQSTDDIVLVSNNYLENNEYLKVQYKSTISTNIKVTSTYFKDTYEYRIYSGDIDPDTSYAELKSSGKIEAGATYNIMIYPKDKYNNDVDTLCKEDMDKFYIYYQINGEITKNKVSNCKLIEEKTESKYEISNYKSIECTTTVTRAGSIEFHVDYVKDEIECRNCQLIIGTGDTDMGNTKTFYKNRQVYLNISSVNEIEAKKEPLFELTFFDLYSNQLSTSVVQNLNIIATFKGSDIKLCVSNSGNKKLINLCPSTNGDENPNKWNYLVNGDKYQLIIENKGNGKQLVYQIKITGGANDGSSDAIDFSKTSFNPEKIEVRAGFEGKTIMELRTNQNVRKNYWYENPSLKIKVEFALDKDTCSYNVENGDLPGRYIIKVKCTKVNNNNSFSVAVESIKIDKKVLVVVTPGLAYYLEVEEVDKFIVSVDKYTWKTNPTNDDEISFNFKLKDKYQNYITTSVLNNNEITVTSETYETNKKYYNILFNENKKDYLFKDLIDVYVNKHTWIIGCVESGRKYSFIYTKLAGEPDVNKSYWTIDKTAYTIEETSTVLVTLLDKLGVNVGTVTGKLSTVKSKVKVDSYGAKNVSYAYIDITNQNNITYTYPYQVLGKYEVHVYYDGKEIKKGVPITVSYQEVDLQSSKLFYDNGDSLETLMLTSEDTYINNLKDYPFYKFYLYTSSKEKITHYDHSLEATCKMTYKDLSWDLDVTKMDSYLKLSYKEGFKPTFIKLPLGNYKLNITFNKKEINYPLYLLGEKDVSPLPNYDLSKTYIKPNLIEGTAGKQYSVEIEFRGSDNLRWNYDIIFDSFTVTDSYSLTSEQLKIVKQKGGKNGQMKLLITQYVATTGKENNILTMTYKSETIPQTIKLSIKCAELALLEYDSGAEDGTVVNPSIVKFTPKDSYDNLCTDLFDEKLYPKKELEKLTTGVSVEKYPLTTNNYVSDGKYLNVQYGCKNLTTIKLTLPNKNPNTYTYRLLSGPISPEKSFAEVENTKNIIAGGITTVRVYPKDVYGNNITKVTKEDLDQFYVVYGVNKGSSVDISKSCSIISNNSYYFTCKTNVTKAGDIKFNVDYTDKNVPCINCGFIINPDKIDFSNTKVFNKNDGKEMSKTKVNELPVLLNTPNFELYFFDRFNNSITNKNEVAELKVTTSLVVTDVKLCVTNNDLTKLSNLCKSQNNDENENKWKYIVNGDKYQLIVTETTTTKSLTFPIKIIGGYNEGDSSPIDPLKTSLNPTELNLIAGEEKTVDLELRTKDDKRKNYWFTEKEKHISVKFPDNVKKCTYSLQEGKRPGQYSIKFVCIEKKDAFQATVLVENTEVPKKITITVNPNGPASSKLFKMTGEEITTANLGSVSVEDKFQIKSILYDKYGNQITNINFQLSTLQIKINSVKTVKSHKYTAETESNKDGVIIITLQSTYAGEHTVEGAYFPLEKYSIVFTHGQPSADNSLLDISHTERYVGEEVKIYITPYDKYNNYINANEYKTTSPYQVKYTNEGNITKIIMQAYSIEEVQGKNVLSYPGTFYVRGNTDVYGYIDTDQIRCVKCRINIKSKDVYFLNSDVLRYESSKAEFETLKNGTEEKNAKEEPVYRLYPRDKYKNLVDFIPKDVLVAYKAYFKNQNESTTYQLKLNNKETVNQKYAEFVINDIEGSQVTYKTLIGGFYDLVFTDGKDKLVYNITLLGDGKGGSNEPADIQQTAIVKQNLKYLAGETGHMMIEIRTKNNVRKNYWDGFNIRVESCDANDKTFKYTQDHGGLLGIFLITVTTEKANTYPKLSKCQLKIYVNNELVKKLNPEQEVSPNAVVRTKILEKYYKDGKSSAVLKDGIADKNYEFEVASYDKYNNLAETLQEVVGITVSLKGGEEVKSTISEIDINTGYRKYNVPATKAGVYTVSTKKAGPGGIYLPNESIFTILHGAIDLSKTVVNEKSTPISAGTEPGISIEVYDKYDNAFDYKDYIDNFTAIFIDSSKKQHTSKSNYDKNVEKLYYISETPVTIVGIVKVEVTYNKKDKIDTSKVIINVIPGDPDPSNSILSRESSSGVLTQYKNGDSLEVDVNDLLILNVTLYDKYKNYISQIPADVDILNPIMSGNYMNEIKFNVTQNTGYFNLDFNENTDYIHIYKHLVGGTYDLTYKVSTTLGATSFKYNIIIKGGDGKHGNGPYDLKKCVLEPKNLLFVAGDYEELTLELRTSQGLLYNDDINVNSDILIEKDTRDISFKSSVEKAGVDYGIYTIKIYSEKKGDYNFNVNLTDPSSATKEKKNVGPVSYTVFPQSVPFNKYTVIKNQPESKVNADNTFDIQFTLADRFNNTFEGRHDIVDFGYLTLINNKEPLSVVSVSLSYDEKTYKMVVYPKYPPKVMVMNVLYSSGDDTVYCFENDINTTVISSIDYYQTQIVSSNKEKIKVGEILDMWLYTFDKKGECLDDQDYSSYFDIQVTGPMDSDKQFIKNYKVKKTEKNESECNNEYQIITTNEDKYKYAGNYKIQVVGGGYAINQFNQVCSPLGYDLNGFLLDYTFDPNEISILNKVSFTVTGTDMYGNKVTDSLINDLEIYFTKDGIKTPFQRTKKEVISGTLNFEDVAIHVVGPHQLHMTYKEQEVLTVNHGEKLPIFTILVGPCRAENNDHFDFTPLNYTKIHKKTHFDFQCYDIYNNKITEGGEKFTVNAIRNQVGDQISVDAEVEDNLDGTYSVYFIPDIEGTYLFNLLVGSEKYGEEVKYTFTKKVCNGEKSILCPNTQECVKDYIDCVEPADKCKEDKTKPFWCLVNGTYTCTKSQVDCDCPKGYIKCKIQNYCVPENRPDMCTSYSTQFCPPGTVKYEDGFCRSKDSRMPNQRVCPIGKVLCADLSCRDNYDECVVTEVRPSNQFRCVGQHLVNSFLLCPSTFTCEKENEVVCPDLECVENEIMCKGIEVQCNADDKPYLCQNLVCAADYKNCPETMACGNIQSLCQDGICRETC